MLLFLEISGHVTRVSGNRLQSCIKVFKRPDCRSQLQPKHVAVNKLIKLMCVTMLIYRLVMC